MWFTKSKSRYITNNTLELFLDEYKNTPGILDVQNNSYSSIVVFFDRKHLPKKALPHHFNGYLLELYDVRKILKDVKHIISKIDIDKDIDEESQDTYETFIHTIELCKQLLRSKQKGKRSEKILTTA